MSKGEKNDLIENAQDARCNGVPVIDFCDAVGVPERSFYKWKKDDNVIDIKRGRKRSPPNKLSNVDKKKVVDLLLRKDWVDYSPREIYYKLLDEERTIIASPSTFYRVAKEKSLLTKRVKNDPKKPLNREKPELSATGINQVWSWDVSQIRSNIRYERYYLYTIIDIWSRFVVGWVLEGHEKTELAIKMWKDALESECITGKDLVNHKDNGSIMTSNKMLKFVKDVKMVDSYSRAGVSDDNPFSESLFGTIKAFRTFPDTFETLDRGREYFERYFHEYNYTYKHSGIQFLTPAERHFGEEGKILRLRNQVISKFHSKNSHRYASTPKHFEPILEVTIN